VIDTDRKIAVLDKSLATLHRTGITTKEMQDELFSLRNRFHRLFHSVDVEKVRSQTADFQTELLKISGRIAAIEAELKHRKFWGGIVVAMLVVWGILALLLFKTYREKNQFVAIRKLRRRNYWFPDGN
jgi:hypothetical protein